MVNLQISIESVPERKEMSEKLQSDLTKEKLEGKIYCDTNHIGIWYNLRRILKDTKEDSTHHLVLQDDIKICKNFANHLNKILPLSDSVFMSLYACRKEIKIDFDKGNSWSKIRNFLGGVGVIFPTKRINEFLNWVDNQKFTKKDIGNDFWKYDDCRTKLFLKSRNEPMYCTVPSLVDHIGWGKSIAHPKHECFKPSVARVFMDDVNKKDIDWRIGF